MMRIALGQVAELSEETLRFARQLGVAGVQLNTPLLPGDGRWHEEDLRWLRVRCERHGLRLEAVENVPVDFYDRAMLGLDGRDEQIANYQETIRAIGRAGIPVLGYHWMPLEVWRTSATTPGRGGALVSTFDAAEAESGPLPWGLRRHPLLGDREIGAEEMWTNYAYFLHGVLPVAAEAGVTLALHPDDPPVPSLGGVARLFHTFAGFERAMTMFPSPNHGLDFCMGTWSEMAQDASPGVIPAIQHFGARGQIVYVHFRDVQGIVPRFNECFVDEGNVDVVAAVRALQEVGFSGFIIDDHVPHMVDDTEWGHRGRAHATGFIAGLVRSVMSLST